MIQGEVDCMKQLKLWLFCSVSLWDLTHMMDESAV